MPEVITKRRGFFFLMLLLNILLAGSISIFLGVFVRQNSEAKRTEVLENTMDSTSTMAQQFDNYLISMDMVGGNYATYIEEEHLSLKESIKYLNHWKDFYYELVLLDVDSMGAWILNGSSDSVSIDDYSGKVWVKQLAQQYKEVTTQFGKITATDAFPDEKTGEAMIAFYKLVRIEERDFLLLFISTVEGIQNGGVNVYGLNPDQGIIIDKIGNVLLGDLDSSSTEKTENFRDYLDERFGAEQAQAAYEKISNTGAGQFKLLDMAGKEFVYTYDAVDVTDGWVYIYQEPMDTLIRDKDTMQFTFWSCLFMGVWLLIDIVAYFLYNQKLRKSLMIIAEQNENLKYANQAKTIFVSNMSHEIRTPINAVLGMDEMIIRESTDEKIKSYAYDIQKAGKVLLGIINDVLDFSKIESGKLEIVPGEYDVVTLVSDICNMIELRAKAKYLAFDVKISPDIPRRLYGDEIRIKQVIINILTNAVKYTEKGSVSFSVNFAKRTEDEICLEVAVKDTGIGIKSEEINKLFSEYDRLDTKKNKNIEGTGLGLPIVKRLLEMMDSKIEVESVYGLGSVFSFKLPQRVVDWEGVGNFERARKNIASDVEEQSEGFKAPKAKILAVDDTPVNLMVVKGLLKRTGMQIDTAENGQKCLEMAKEKAYDLILLDHRMPGMDGIETIHHLRAEDGMNRKTPVIALTANVVSGAKEMYLKEGFNDFLSKPINSNQLENMILGFLPKEYIEEMEQCGDIDQDAGIEACGGQDIYTEVKEAFAEQAELVIKEIRGYYDKRDLKNYITLVHGLKSSARLLGAIKLSDEARKLEESGKNEDWDAIHKGTEDLLIHYAQIAKKAGKI